MEKEIPAIEITGNLDFEDFKRGIHKKLIGNGLDIEKLQNSKDYHLCAIKCRCGKIFYIDNECDYKDTICECGKVILIHEHTL